MRELLRRTDDAGVHRVVRDYLEGRISRRRLFRDPGVAAVLARWYRHEIEGAVRQGYRPEMMAQIVAQARDLDGDEGPPAERDEPSVER